MGGMVGGKEVWMGGWVDGCMGGMVGRKRCGWVDGWMGG